MHIIWLHKQGSVKQSGERSDERSDELSDERSNERMNEVTTKLLELIITAKNLWQKVTAAPPIYFK